MLRGLIQAVMAPSHIQKGQGAAVGKAQRNVQIPQPHIAVDAQDPQPLFRQSSGDTGTDRGFSRSALTGQDRKKLAQA